MFYLNGNPVMFGNFPNKEFNMDIQKLDIQRGSNAIEWHYEDDGDLFKLITLKSYLESQDASRVRLYIGYMPYSRMDRMNDFYAMSLKFACKTINEMNFYKVTIREPHSDVTPALLDRCFIHNWCQDFMDCKDTLNEKFEIINSFDSVFFPDAGAQKRYKAERPSAVGYKDRDFETGEIKSFEIKGDVGKNVLIVDDLCSRGGTFIYSSIELKKAGAENVSLLVAHCEENVFTGDLFNHIDMIYTSKGMLTNMLDNSKCPIVNKQAEQIKEL